MFSRQVKPHRPSVARRHGATLNEDRIGPAEPTQQSVEQQRQEARIKTALRMTDIDIGNVSAGYQHSKNYYENAKREKEQAAKERVRLGAHSVRVF